MCPDTFRVLSLRVPKDATKEPESDNDYEFILMIYDKNEVVLVNSRAECCLINRDHLVC